MLKCHIMVKTQIECILLSGVEERVTKADAETICAFHQGWLVDMDEGRGDDDDAHIKMMMMMMMMTMKMMMMIT